MNKETFTVRKMVRCAVVAAIYVALCLGLAPFSYGAVQVRVAEALCLLPIFGPEYILGVTLGCALANLLGSTMIDVVFGTLATPILWNAVIVGTEIAVFFSDTPATPALILANALSVGAGEIISCGVLGVALVRLIESNPRLRQVFSDEGIRAA